MSMMSLREQLLKAGLVNEKQVQDVERQQQSQRQQAQHQESKRQRDGLSPQQRERERQARQARASKAARDQELNRKYKEKAEQKARQAEVRQLIEEHRLPKPETEERYNFVDGRKIRRIRADGTMRERLRRGEIFIARWQGTYEWVDAAIATRIRERDPRAIVDPTATSVPAGTEGVVEDDAYKDFQVPDDLMW